MHLLALSIQKNWIISRVEIFVQKNIVYKKYVAKCRKHCCCGRRAKNRGIFSVFSPQKKEEKVPPNGFAESLRIFGAVFSSCSPFAAGHMLISENLVESRKKKAEKNFLEKRRSAAAINIISLPFQTSYFFPSGFMWESHALTSFFGFLLPLLLGSNGTRMGETETSGGPNIPFPPSFIFSFRSQDDCVEKFRGNGGGWILFNIPQPQP